MEACHRSGVCMNKRKEVKLYNILLPVWILIFWPSFLWLFLIPANYFIDRIVLKWSLGGRKDRGLFCRKHTWKICLAGFAGDFAGACLLFAVFMAAAWAGEGSSAGDFFRSLGEGVGFNPFNSIFSLAVVGLSIFISGLLIYLMDRSILVRTGLDMEQAKKTALRLALITAPYLYLFPSEILYRGGLF